MAMRRRASSKVNGVAAAVVLGAFLAGCHDQPTELTLDDADVIMAVTSMSLTMLPGAMDGSQPYTRACPDGGQLVVEGTDSWEADGDDSVNHWDQIMRQEDCAMTVQSPTGSLSVVANGEMHIFGEARFGPPVGQQSPLLMQESGQVGTMTTRHGDQTFTCDLDLTNTFDAGAGNYRITGTACGRSIDVRAPAHP